MDFDELGLPDEQPEPIEKPAELEEVEDWEIGNVHYRATKREANEIGLRSYATDEWLEYCTADDLMRFTPALAGMTLQDWREIVRARAAAWRKYHLVCLRIVQEVLA